jgi:hypothetical protein
VGSGSSKAREVEIRFIGSKEVLVCWLGLIAGLNLKCWIRSERVNDRYVAKTKSYEKNGNISSGGK